MQEITTQYQWIILILVIWSIPWKGMALWRAARNGQKVWFVLLFLLNTLAILEIIYLLFIGKKKNDGSKYRSMDDGGQNDGISRKII